MAARNTIDPNDLTLDPLAELTMTYTSVGFAELKASIEREGQHVPIALRNGKIIDGRHRARACKALGIAVKYEELGDITYEEALDYVISKSISKAIGCDASRVEAYLMCKMKKVKQKEMPEIFKRLNINYVRKMSFIEKEDPRYLTALLRQKRVVLYNKERGRNEEVGTIHGIWYLLKANKIVEEQVIEVEPDMDQPVFDLDVEQTLPNKMVRDYYWEALKACNVKHPASDAGLAILRLAKLALDITNQSATLAPNTPNLEGAQ